MAIKSGFQDFFYSFNENNKARGQPAFLKTKQALFPVALIEVFRGLSFMAFVVITEALSLDHRATKRTIIDVPSMDDVPFSFIGLVSSFFDDMIFFYTGSKSITTIFHRVSVSNVRCLMPLFSSGRY